MSYGDDPVADAAPAQTIRVRLSPDQLKQLVSEKGYSPGGTAGIVQNFTRESGGDTGSVGDQGTSFGLANWHLDRGDALKKYAADHGKDWQDPSVQLDFFDNEMKAKYPKLREQLTQPGITPGESEALFRRFYERPKETGYDNAPSVASDKFRFSDYALRQHQNDPGTDVVYMSPSEYLSLAPRFEGTDAEARADRSLRKSLARGDAVEEIPSLDVNVDASGAKVTGQDGRHRALLAQENGIDMIPVAVKRAGTGGPITELQGMQGDLVPYNFQKVPETPITHGAAGAFATNVAAGIARTGMAGEQLLGRGLSAVGLEGAGEDLQQRAARGMAQIDRDVAGDVTAHPIASEAGNIVGGGVLPTLATAPIKGGAALVGGVSGAVAGAMQPVDPNDPDYWRTKALDIVKGGAAGAALPIVGGAAARLAQPVMNNAARLLMQEGVRLTPGQMAGGALRWAEDTMASVPGLGVTIRAAQRKAVETFNKAAINRALADIGKELPPGLDSGHNAIGFAQDEFSKAYQQVIPQMVGTLDPDLRSALVDVMQQANSGNLPQEFLDQLHFTIGNEIVERFNAGGGRINGEDAQKIGTQLDALTKSMRISPNPYVQNLAQWVKRADTAFDQMMERNNPTLQPIKDRIDSGYAKFKTVQDAAGKASILRESPDGTFTPAQLNAAVRARDRSKDKAAFARGDALLQDLASAARERLPNVVPNSGTPERAALLAMLAGGAHFSPIGAAAVGAGAAAYTSPGMRLLNAFARSGMPQTASILRRGSNVLAPFGGLLGAAATQPPQQQ